MFDLSETVQRIAISFVPLLLGIVCHEVGHGYVAWRLGDPTAKAMGRLTLNPLPHIDPTGALVFVVTALFSPIVFGWAKPVPINPRYFKDPRKGMVLVSLAGPGVNIALAVLFAALLKVIQVVDPGEGSWLLSVLYPLFLICQAGVIINLVLAFINLVPIPPLDGSKIVAGLLPPLAARRYLAVERYGFIVLVLLLATGLLGKILLPLLNGGYILLARLFGLN